MDFATFKTLVKAAANRGTTLDSFLSSAVNGAIGAFESNYSLPYMRVTGSGTLASGDSSFALPTRHKSFRFIRLHDTADDGSITYTYLKRISPEQVTSFDVGGVPAGYWIDGDDTVRFDAEVDESTDYSYQHFQFSAELSADGDTHWFLDTSQRVLLLQYQTLVELAPQMRDEKLLMLYQQRVQEHLKVLMNAIADFDWEGADMSMNYGTDYSN